MEDKLKLDLPGNEDITEETMKELSDGKGDDE